MNTETRGASVCIENVVKKFTDDGPLAVNDVSLDIKPGEFMTLLGPSGSGKTTTLNIIAGFEEATSGRVLVDGEDVLPLPPYKRNLGMVFQNYALFPHMTVAANVAFPLQQRRISKREVRNKVQTALEVVGLAGYENRTPKQLSGGQQQRVALARAFVFEPPVLLMDEPLGALDKRLREQLQSEIARIHRELGVTVVFVTHDQDEALSLSDRIAVYREGRIEQCGTPEELYANPKSVFVADFLGDSNIYRGTVGSSATADHIEIGDRTRVIVPAQGLAAGSTAAVMIRPELMELYTTVNDVPASAMNTLDVSIQEVVYQGASQKVRFATSDGVAGIVRGSGRNVGTYSVGDRAVVAWNPDHAVVFPSGDLPVQAESFADTASFAMVKP